MLHLIKIIAKVAASIAVSRVSQEVANGTEVTID